MFFRLEDPDFFDKREIDRWFDNFFHQTPPHSGRSNPDTANGFHNRSVLVLVRKNSCHGIELDAWQKSLSILHPNVRVSTIHRAKGAESDVVLLLKESNAGSGRLSHLNTVLGITEAEVQAEERRIEYVAITRPKERLIVIE